MRKEMRMRSSRRTAGSVPRPALVRSPFVLLLGVLVLVRTALPLAVLARAGEPLLEGFPTYEYEPTPGDAYGYYSATRELMATLGHLGPVLSLVVVLALVGLAWVVAALLRGRGRPDVAAFAGVACVAAILLALVLRMQYAGAPTIGWPAVWAAALLPFRALGLAVDPDVGFGFAVALSLLANVVTVVATFLLGAWASGRRAVGMLAAALAAVSPLLLLLLGKTREPGTWGVELGLYAYSEPLSTALVVAAAALLVRRPGTRVAAVAAGALLGFAVTVRLSNALIAVAAVAVLVASGRRAFAARAAATGMLFLPVVAAYWDLGYARLMGVQVPEHAFALGNAESTWVDSTVWGWRALVALVPLAIVGAFRLPAAPALLLTLWIGGTALFYTFYSFTALHPRFLLVVLPALYVLWAAGAIDVVQRVRRLRPARADPP
jgi:hypothetical protein